jgi:hypothetical protein
MAIKEMEVLKSQPETCRVVGCGWGERNGAGRGSGARICVEWRRR